MTYKAYAYLVKFLPTGQVYYGSRFKNQRLKLHPHEDLWVKYFTSCDTVKRLVKEHGKDSFDVEIRRTFTDKVHAASWEGKVLKRTRAKYKDNWFNSTDNETPIPGPEGLKKISNTHLSVPKTAEHAAKIGNKLRGRKKGPLSQERKDWLSERFTGEGNPMHGVPCSEERKAKISATKLSNPKPAWNKGIPKTQEEKDAHSKKMKGRKKPGGFAEQQRIAHLGKKHPEERKLRIAASNVATKARKKAEREQKMWDDLVGAFQW
jgi:hypothetical protein